MAGSRGLEGGSSGSRSLPSLAAGDQPDGIPALQEIQEGVVADGRYSLVGTPGRRDGMGGLRSYVAPVLVLFGDDLLDDRVGLRREHGVEVAPQVGLGTQPDEAHPTLALRSAEVREPALSKQAWPTQPFPDDARVVGEVKWTARSFV